MSVDQQLILYTGPHCSLCEKAKQVIWPVIAYTGHGLQEVDVTSDVALLRRYRIQIPVVHCNGRDLCWPFDETALYNWLSQQ